MKTIVATTATDPTTMKKTPMITDPSKMLDISNYLYGFAALLTLLATFGVIYFGRVASKIKDAQVKQYQKDADERIAHSYETAASANSNAEAARANAEQARADAATANAHTEELKRQRAAIELTLSGLQNTNTQLTTQLQQLQSAATARALTSEQMKAIVEALVGVSKAPIKLKVTSKEYEAFNYAERVRETLTQAGFSVNVEPTNEIFEGFGVVAAIPYPTTEIGIGIQQAFARAGTGCQWFVSDKLQVGQFFIFVGSKPQLKR